MKKYQTSCAVIVLLAAGLSVHAKTIYVKADASGVAVGSNWTNAYTSLATAMSAAAAGDEIWVAAGTYGTTTGFTIPRSVAIYGGFAGAETVRDARQWTQNLTILDGNNKAAHVVTCSTSAVIDGFTVTRGRAAQTGPGAGLAKIAVGTDPSSIMSSKGAMCGAGILVFQAGGVVINNCVITGNYAGKGGGLYVMTMSSVSPVRTNLSPPTITNCTICNDTATGRGGGVSVDCSTNAIFTNCIFRDNVCLAKGGGVYLDFGCSGTYTNCLFYNNKAMSAAAMGIDGSGKPTLYNCTITKNFARDIGAGVYMGSYAAGTPPNQPTVKNCIIWGNKNRYGGPEDVCVFHEDFPSIYSSDIGNGFYWFYDGCLNTDPLFTDWNGNDFTLRIGSPCINAGTAAGAPANDLTGTPRDANVDIGAFEYGSPAIVADPIIRQRVFGMHCAVNRNCRTLVVSGIADEGAELAVWNLKGARLLSVRARSAETTLSLAGFSPGFFVVTSGSKVIYRFTVQR
jgi:hypothetical protein